VVEMGGDDGLSVRVDDTWDNLADTTWQMSLTYLGC
jgi:hypothetical protein